MKNCSAGDYWTRSLATVTEVHRNFVHICDKYCQNVEQTLRWPWVPKTGKAARSGQVSILLVYSFRSRLSCRPRQAYQVLDGGCLRAQSSERSAASFISMLLWQRLCR